MNPDHLSSIAAMVICVILSGYFSATETAFSSVNRTRLKAMAEKGDHKAELALKLAEDYDKALWRARNIASPKNAQRIGVKTPCAAKGDRCYNCSSPERICRVLTVFWGAPMGSDCEVVLVKEDLGY